MVVMHMTVGSFVVELSVELEGREYWAKGCSWPAVPHGYGTLGA